ncbi:CBS domain-containing protein CBSCBSPB1 [Tripterygium wilfordii]|uniref:CBS domain-containing protein CBSCBSPB1 n=1 Tax=Tripterygium wilfordii TaxID=458696 RepID=A0A7J7CE68_TRIWF|nr:CBS domain-containing protein CBSCBSPB1 [Tripterygium wilfordii]
MASHGGSSRKSSTLSSTSLSARKKASENVGSDLVRKSLTSSRSMGVTGERTVKRLRLSKALTVPKSTTIYEACHRMAARRVDALLLTDSNALLCGILTDKDIATRGIARELNLEETPVSKVMTRNPVFVLSDTLAVEALQKMVHGKFRHLPVVENGEVAALLDIAKCLYDAILLASKGQLKRGRLSLLLLKAPIHSLRQFENGCSGPHCPQSFQRIQSRVVTVSPTDTVLMATKEMLQSRSSSAVVVVDNKPRGILTSKYILMRVIAQNLSPGSTDVEKVMTPNPECATIDTSIVDALHSMHDGKFLHLPVVDRGAGIVVAVDVIHITHAAVATVGNTGGLNNEAANTMMQKFWDSAMALSHNDDDEETHSTKTKTMTTLCWHLIVILPLPLDMLDQPVGRYLLSCPLLMDAYFLWRKPRALYPLAYLLHGGLRLHLDYSRTPARRRGSSSESLDYAQTDAWASAYSAVAAGAALVAGLGLLAYLKRSNY